MGLLDLGGWELEHTISLTHTLILDFVQFQFCERRLVRLNLNSIWLDSMWICELGLIILFYNADFVRNFDFITLDLIRIGHLIAFFGQQWSCQLWFHNSKNLFVSISFISFQSLNFNFIHFLALRLSSRSILYVLSGVSEHGMCLMKCPNG